MLATLTKLPTWSNVEDKTLGPHRMIALVREEQKAELKEMFLGGYVGKWVVGQLIEVRTPRPAKGSPYWFCNIIGITGKVLLRSDWVQLDPPGA